MGHFTVKSKCKLAELEVNSVISESDYATLSNDGTFVQLEYHEDDDISEKYKVKPGIWSISVRSQQLILEPTSFVTDEILDSFVSTKEITTKIDMFFKNIHVYKKFGFEIPKRGMLLYGPAGSGKSTSIVKITQTYNDGKTAIVVWATDKFESYKVKDFIKTFEYVGVERIILIAEDIGGVEMDQRRHPSDPALLSLLDNKEKTFKIPVFILATTNFPEVFMGNIANRPDRFDDKIQVGFPGPQYREELFKFFAKEEVSEETLEMIRNKKCEEFSPAHLREVVIRAAIHEKTHPEVILEIQKEIAKYKKGFEDREARMGISLD